MNCFTRLPLIHPVEDPGEMIRNIFTFFCVRITKFQMAPIVNQILRHSMLMLINFESNILFPFKNAILNCDPFFIYHILRCFVKFAPHLWSKKIHFNRSSSNFTNWFSTTWSVFPRNLNEFPRFLSILFEVKVWHLMIFIHGTLLRAVASVLEVLLLYISKRKRRIPSILQPHIPTTLLYDVLVFYQKL